MGNGDIRQKLAALAETLYSTFVLVQNVNGRMK
jgi:hypothetical protein